jgi:hypothetical protein
MSSRVTTFLVAVLAAGIWTLSGLSFAVAEATAPKSSPRLNRERPNHLLQKAMALRSTQCECT